MRVITSNQLKLHGVPRNRRSYPQLAAGQALTRAQVLAARKADITPKQSVVLHAA